MFHICSWTFNQLSPTAAARYHCYFFWALIFLLSFFFWTPEILLGTVAKAQEPYWCQNHISTWGEVGEMPVQSHSWHGLLRGCQDTAALHRLLIKLKFFLLAVIFPVSFHTTRASWGSNMIQLLFWPKGKAEGQSWLLRWLKLCSSFKFVLTKSFISGAVFFTLWSVFWDVFSALQVNKYLVGSLATSPSLPRHSRTCVLGLTLQPLPQTEMKWNDLARLNMLSPEQVCRPCSSLVQILESQ